MGMNPTPPQNVLIMHLDNIYTRKLFGLHHGFKICTGARYLGGFIRDDNSKCDWLIDRTLNYKKNIISIIKMAEKYPQLIYAAVVCAIQPE